MQSESIDALVHLVAAILKRGKRRFLFLLTESNQKKETLLAELKYLLETYPDSMICIDQMADALYSAVIDDMSCNGRLLKSRQDIRQEILYTDGAVALSFDLSTLQKVALGISDSHVSYACSEALLRGKRVIVAEDDYRDQLKYAGETYRKNFEEARARTEEYGMIYCAIHDLRSVLEADFSGADVPEILSQTPDPGRRQVVTVEEIAKNKDLVIREDAIITPAARELLKNREA